MRTTVPSGRGAVLAAAGLAMTLVIACDGGAPTADHDGRRPPPGGFVPSWPVFSSGGDTIYVIGQELGRWGVGIFAIDTAGATLRDVLFDDDLKADLRLSPDGRSLAYFDAPYPLLECCGGLRALDLATRGTRELLPVGARFRDPHFSPDGRFLLVDGEIREDDGTVHSQVVRVAFDGSGPRVLTRGSRAHREGRYDKDGARIFCTVVDTSNPVTVTNVVLDADGAHERFLDAERTFAGDPLPSPRRNEVAMFRRPAEPGAAGGYIVGNDTLGYPAAPGAFRKITPAFPVSSAWSPDGERIGQVYADSVRPNDPDLYVVEREGWRLRRLTVGRRVGFWSWSPDSRHIVFTARSSSGSGIDLFLADTNTGFIRQLTIHR